MSLIGLAGLALSFGAALIFITFSAGMVGNGRRSHNASPIAALYFMVVGGAVFVISAQNFGLVSLNMPFEQVEIFFTLASGPLFFILIHRLLGKKVPAPLFFAPALLFFSGAAAGMLDVGIRAAVLLQMSYTGLAALSTAGMLAAKNNSSRRQPKRIALVLLAVMASMHLTQIARMIFAEYAASAYLVPTVISLFAVGLVIAAVKRANLLPRLQRSRNANPDALSLDAVSRALRGDPRLQTPDYRLEDLAEAARVRSETLSRLINQETGRGFVAFVNRERVRLACDLLQSPDEQETSIDAIALMVGFKSRSAFYRAFTETMGVTPGNYRKNMENLS